ncbi:GtrA family protein [Lactobacillus rodentium]|uniref:Cell wall teichoic acid glycosylation protein n=1 Tax=Lactobacillus rodentium TaxID=947835 RepID=A0A2Z6T6J1_9LACO|nr:GtrA family protein [Lactobacillus rodentium]MCR1894544.1 GtrA family protein [Lactobacillus rodentium]GBG04744.1 cell wall teichoic acid glycosylation protein [Lactobacillus rodentium]
MAKDYPSESKSINKGEIRKLGNRLVARHHDFYAYTFFGFLASIINIIAFALFHNWLKIPWFWANIMAFIVSTFSSFSFNKHGVFTHNKDLSHGVCYQLVLFFFYRILSLVPDNLIMFCGLSLLHWNTIFVKSIDQIGVGLFNYFTTKSIFIESSSKFAKMFKKMTNSPIKKGHK